MSSNPEIRVKLSTQGLTEVIGAIRQLTNEAVTLNKTAAGGVTSLRSGVGMLRNAVGALGITTSIAGVVAFGKAAFDAADEAGNLATQLGLSTEEFTRIAYAADQSDIAISDVGAGLTFYQKKLAEAVSGNRDAASSFKQIGLDAKELQKLSVTEQLGLIADRIKNLRESSDQLKASGDLFGRGFGGPFLRVLKDGSAGLREFAAESDATGNTLRSSTAAGIDAADAAVKRLKNTLSGATTKAIGGVALVLESIGMSIGVINKDETVQAQAKLEALLALRNRLNDAASVKGLTQPGILTALELVAGAAGIKKLDAEILALQKHIEELQGKQKPAAASGGSGSLINLPTEAELKALSKASVDQLKARSDSELKVLQEGLKDQEREAKAAYDLGVISLTEYYDRRRAVIDAKGEIEVKALETNIRAIQSVALDPKDAAAALTRATEVEKLRSEIKLKQLETENAIAALISDEVQAQHQLGEQEVALSNSLLELEGKRHQLFENNLAKEAQSLRELLTRAGAAPAEIQEAIDRLTKARTASFSLDEATRAGSLALEAFQRDAEQIHRDQEAGVIGQLQGEFRLIELERSRLVVLRELADAMLKAAEATGDEQKIAQAQQFAASIDEIAASLANATDLQSKFIQGGTEAFQSGVQSLLQNLEQIHSVEDAFRSLARTVAQELQRIAAEIIAKQATFALLRAFGGAFSAGAAPAAGSFTQQAITVGAGQHGGPVQTYAQGDVVRGRKLNIRGPDKVPALLEENEFVVRRRVATQPGALAFLRAFNNGEISAADISNALNARLITPRRFAEGGLVSDIQPSSKSGRTAGLTGTLGLEDGLIMKHLESDDFDRLLIRRIGRMKDEFNTVLR